MTPLARLPWRLLAAALGFLAAVLGAVATVLVTTLSPILTAPDLVTARVALDGNGVLDLALLGEVAGRAIFPGWLVFAVLAEIVGTRSLLVHLIAFAAIALLATLGFLEAATGIATRLAVAAGFVGGFLHWLVAGRSAGIARPTETGGGDPREPHG